ncbi:MAG: phosphatidic acid phosphatase type 2/haloperoxidase [Benjaminiella poitrasii]|nr:MAG: phosphatidic acid phosphatase type 2/haloperoxidase [Benjaminiella poitrasii]
MSIGHEGHGLASISLTHVYFNPLDKVSYAFAYITLAPIAILVFYASAIVSRREMAGILMLLGQLTNEAVNYVLKETIEQERPHVHLGDGYGMPSSHSQFIWYFAVYGILYLYKYVHLDHSIWKLLASLGMSTLAILVSISRIYLGYHTLNQVIIGSLVGSLFGLIWYIIVKSLHAIGIIKAILETSIARKLYLKDMTFIDNAARWEYEQWLQERKKITEKNK